MGAVPCPPQPVALTGPARHVPWTWKCKDIHPPGGDLKCPILPVCPAMQEVDTCAVRPETGVAIILCIS